MAKIITTKRAEGEAERAKEYVKTHILFPSGILGLILMISGTVQHTGARHAPGKTELWCNYTRQTYRLEVKIMDLFSARGYAEPGMRWVCGFRG